MSNSGTHHNQQSYKLGQDLVVNTNSLSKMKLPDEVAKRTDSAAGFISDQMVSTSMSHGNNARRKAQDRRANQQQISTNHASSHMSSQAETPGSGNYLQNYQQPLDEMNSYAEENVTEEELALWANSASHSSIVPGTPSQQQVQAPSQAFISPNITKFKQNLLKTLQKFAKVHTQQKGAEELKILMTTDITDNERMIMFLSQLAEVNEHMNLGQMKEQIKQFGVAAEIFEDALVPFIPRILSSFQKKIKDESTVKLHAVISEALGQLQWHVLGRVEDPQEQIQLFEQHFQKFAFGMIEKTKSRNVQCGALACLTKIIVNCPDEILFEKFEEITDKMCEIVRSKNFLAHQQFLESLISLIFHIQIDFKYYYEKFLPYLIEQIQKSKDAQTTRVAIDALYSIGAHLKEEIVSHIDDLLPILNVCRVDKNQPVRAAAQETIKLFKELKETANNPDYDEDQISNEDFQQDLIQDNDMLRNLNDSTQHYEKKSSAKLKGSSQTGTISHVGELAPNDGIANSETLYPSFADLQSSSEQAESSKLHKKNKQLQNKKHDYLKRNKSRQESNTSRSQIDAVNADPDHQVRAGTKARIKAMQQTSRCKSPSMSQNLTAEPNEQSQLMVIESNRSKSRTKADYRRGANDSQMQLKNSKQKSQAKLADSVSPNRLGSPKRAIQEGKSQRSQFKGNQVVNATLDASMDHLHSQQEMLLNPNYLKDKSIKKVSIATLKRRMNQQKTLQSPEKSGNMSRGQDNQSNLRQHINSMREANSKLGIRGKQYGLTENEYDEVPQSQKNADAKHSKRGNFLDKLNPDFMNKFNDQPQSQKNKNESRKNRNKEQSSDDDELDDVPITIVSSKQPVDIDQIIEMQRIAEFKYQQQQEEEEEKYRGLTMIEKRKQIIADTQLLQQKEGKGETKKVQQNNKAKDKSAKKKKSLTQRPKWQNIIDDEEEQSDGQRVRDAQVNERESQQLNQKSKKNTKKNQSHRQGYDEADDEQAQPIRPNLKQRTGGNSSDNEADDQHHIIIKTDKNSKQRQSKIERNQNREGPPSNNFNAQAKYPKEQYGSGKQEILKQLQNDDFWRPRAEDKSENSEDNHSVQAHQVKRPQQTEPSQSTGIAWLSQSQMPPSRVTQVTSEQQEGDTAGSVSAASIQRSLKFKTDNFTNDSLILNHHNPHQSQYLNNNDGSAQNSSKMPISKHQQEFDPNSSQFILDNQIKASEPMRSPPYGPLNDQISGMQMPQLYNQNSNQKFQQELEQKIMMQFQLQQQKISQNIDLMNSKFEMVISKLDSIQNNYDRLDRQQKEMQIQLQKQQQSTNILSDCYKTLLQNPQVAQIGGSQQPSTQPNGASPPPQLQSARLPPAYTSSNVFPAGSLNENISLSDLLNQLNNDKISSSASGADSQQQQMNQEKSQQEQQQLKDQQKSDLEQLSALIGKINSSYGATPGGIQQSQQLLNHEIASVTSQQQQQQSTQNEQAIQLRKLQESLDLVNAINGRNPSSSTAAGTTPSALPSLSQQPDSSNSQLLNALLLSQQLQQRQQSTTPSHFQSLEQLQGNANSNQLNSNFSSTSQINDYLKNNLKYL